MLNIVLQDLKETVQIILHFLNKSLLCVGSESESGITCATDYAIYAGITNFHETTRCLEFT